MRHCVSPECCGWPACKCTEDLIAPRAVEAGEDAFEKWWLANGWETHEAHSKAVARTVWAASRPAIIEECARVCEQAGPRFYDKSMKEAAESCAAAIRALAPGGQNAAPQVISGDQGACQQDGPRQVPPAVAAPDELRKAYFEGYEDALKDRSAPAEVAEGAGEVPDVCIANDPLRTRFDLPRAAPPLSREEWGMLYRLLDKEIPPGVKTAELEPWIALRAKVREAAKSRP